MKKQDIITFGPETDLAIAPSHIREHIDMTIQILDSAPHSMEKQKITEEDVLNQIRKMKTNKAPGPDGLKTELYKEMTGSKAFIKNLTNGLNKALQEGDIPRGWKMSNTTLIPKKDKPIANEFRPIALLNTSYKIFMGAIREKLEAHLRTNGLLSEFQNGFTSYRSTTDNLFILNYCIEKSYKAKKELYVTSIDFQKAFDSVDRKALIEVMKRYRIDPNIINTIVEIYSEDSTSLHLNREKQTEIKVTSGVRQGCNCSTILFIMVTYVIIERLQQAKIGFKNRHVEIPAIFYADDGLVFSQSLHDCSSSIEILMTVARECGLEINEKKSKILIYTASDTQSCTHIRNIEIVNSIKYLGVTLTNKRNCFNEHKKLSLLKAQRLSNVFYSVMTRACDRLLIGKTFWKGLAMPAFLYGSEVIHYTKTELLKFQVLDNKIYRGMLRAPPMTAVEGLRGDVGASSSVARDMKNKLSFARHCLREDTNELVRFIFTQQFENEDNKWINQLKDYMKIINVSMKDLENMNFAEVRTMIDDWDTKSWNEAAAQKSTLGIYHKFKKEIEQESWFNNRED